jgi:nucleotide-binding universal stress UspA family protein
MPTSSFHIKKILIPIDFSETSLLAIEHAAFTAQLLKAELVLLHIIEKHYERFNVVVPQMSIDAPSEVTNAIEERLEGIAADIQKKYGVKSTCITTRGNIFEEVISISKENEADIIVMGTHGTSGFVDFFLGSNTYKVITKSEIPVLSVQAHAKQVGFQKIVLPIDNSAHSRQKVHHAIVIANHFASVIEVIGLGSKSAPTEYAQIEAKIAQVEKFIKDSNIACSSKMIDGSNQAKMTLEYADGANADLIIIMGDQEENITGRFMGAYSQQIVNHSSIPTLTIQPIINHLSSTSSTSPFFE